MAIVRKISLHPLFAAALDLVAAALVLWQLSLAASFSVFVGWMVLRTLWWLVLTELCYYPPFVSRWRHFATLLFFNAALMGLLLFVDSIFLVGVVYIFLAFVPAVSFVLVPNRPDSLSVLAKPERRWRLAMTTLAMGGLWAMVSAVGAFQLMSGWWLVWLSVEALGILIAVSMWWWREYGRPYSGQFFIAAGIMALIFGELAYIVYLWPIGYLAVGFLMAALWYTLWLLLRFSLTPEGIDWQRQKWFLMGMAIVITFYLVLVARWK